MKKSLKISLIILGVLVGIIILDTIQALVFNNNAIIGIETKGMVRHGILVNTYHCGNGKNITRFRLSNYIGESVCGKNININLTELEKIHTEIDKKLEEYENKNGKKYTNCSSTGVDQSINKVVITLVDNSEKEQQWFRENIYDSSYIIFKQGGPYTTSSSKIEVIKPTFQNDNKFNIYLERDNRTIYLSSSLEEVYYTDNDTKMSLKEYISKSYQTTDDGIKHLTDIMDNTETFRDGGTKIYKSKDYDITIIKCNTVSGNHNYYIGDYAMQFDDETMCK